ncbi:MAG: hypothetical protein JST80_07040 [Bdellovibrionales bacterium]|nr:hypothetical protein [Bdellovibrionales bacterium]
MHPVRSARSSAIFICVLLLSGGFARADQPAVYIPLDELKSAPAKDLLYNGKPIDPGVLASQMEAAKHQGKEFDTSSLEPQQSDVYSGTRQSIAQDPAAIFPVEKDQMVYDTRMPTVYTRGMVRARILSPQNTNLAYNLYFSLDSHAALARNALFRALGYTIPVPKYFPKVTVNFSSLSERDKFLDLIADKTLTARGRWVVGGLDEINKNLTTITFQDAVIEPAIIGGAPPLHWGILTSQVLDNRRSLRAAIVPLSLVDIPESVNMYSFETGKISNENLTFSRPYADAFANSTSIGDVKWIAKRIAKLTRKDWISIIQAAHYPPDIQALIVEKTIGRTVQLLSLLNMNVSDDNNLKYDPYITYGQVINGKAVQESYDGYALRFTYGDPKSPLRASELLRFFGIESISSGLGFLIEKVAGYLQIITPDKYVQDHNNRVMQDVMDHISNHPNEPYVQPLQVWGGPIAGGSIKASRNVVTGTYYGSNSEVQLVDVVSAGINVGAFVGVSGLGNINLGLSPQVQYNRSYVHVRPIQDIKTAWKDNWKKLYVPHFMSKLSGILNGEVDQDSGDAIKAFLDTMKTGEMFIVTDGFAAGNGTTFGIPLGAILGFAVPFSNINESVTLANQYGILSRTTIYKTDDGMHVYLSRVNARTFEMSFDTSFFIKLLTLSSSKQNGDANTKAFVFPDHFDTPEKEKTFQRSITAILRRNNPHILEEEFFPYVLDHDVHGSAFKFKLGPWSWTNRVNYHRLDILPPYDPDGKYSQQDEKRTVIQGEITKVKGSDWYGFFGKLVKRVVPFVSIGQSAVGDDPSSNFLGKSKTFAVSSEVELTPNRPNKFFTKLQQSYNGWSMNKRRLLRLADEITKELQEFNPPGGLVSKDQFAQTRKVQAYTLMWTLLVYEKGINRMMKLMNIKETSTKEAQNFMVDLMGKDKYAEFCNEQGVEPGIEDGPYIGDSVDGTLVENTKGRTTLVSCVTPWMITIYDMRSRLEKHPEAFMTEVREEDDAVARIKWVNRTFAELEKNMELGQLIRWIGKDASHFQVRISGFRTADETADSERYSTYFSNTIGTIDENVLGGPMSDIAETSQILEHELSARYLSNGY